MIYYKTKHLSIIAAGLFAMIFVSCTKNFEAINTPWNGSPTATVPQLYTAFVSNLAQGDAQVTYNSWTYPITQQGVVYTKPDYSYGNDGNEDWSKFYHNLSNYNSMMGVIAASPDTTIYTNVKAIMKVLKAYQAIKLSNFYGDMPYSDAGKAIYYGTSNYTPTYDTQQSIYLSCLADLKWAVDNLNANDTKQYSLGSGDLVLLNNISQWIEFANSLRLRIAVTMYDKDPADATAQITDALSKPLLDADGTNVGLYPGTNIPNMDLGARQYSFGTECRLRMGTTMWQWMSSTNAEDGSGIFDPRCNIFFEPNNDTLWNPFPQNPTVSTPAEGGDPYNIGNRKQDWADKNGNNGTVNLYADYNYYWSVDVNIPELFMTAAEVHFIKAEIYARGLGVSANAASAQTEYNAGVTASVNFWTNQAINSQIWVVNKPTGLPDLTAFFANPIVAFDAADPTVHGLQQIYAQEWIDMFRQPWEAWTLMKRTGGQTPMDANNAAYYTQTYGNYNRYQYPGSEQTYNSTNYLAELSKVGGKDLVSTKIWIAK
jgi:SusD/RagB-like outer membrane lipoprotein